jgi:hypothetical protein
MDLTYENKVKNQNSERQRRFYQAHKAEILEKKKVNHKKIRDCYKEQQLIKANEPVIVPVVPAEPVNHEYVTAQDIYSKLSEKSRKNYKASIASMMKITNSKNFLRTIQDAKKLIKQVKTATYYEKKSNENFLFSSNSKRLVIQAINVSINELGLNVPESQKKLYNTYWEELGLDARADQEERQSMEEVMDFTQYLELIHTQYGVLSKEFVISKLYHEVTVRDDFQLVIVGDIEDATDSTKQYIIVPLKKTTKLTVIINNYKTDAFYGQIVENLSLSLSKIIRNYIADKRIAYGEMLFGNSKTNSGFVSKMNRDLGMPEGVGAINNFRKMRASEFDLTSEQRVELSQKMKNSPMVNLKYIRKILKTK